MEIRVKRRKRMQKLNIGRRGKIGKKKSRKSSYKIHGSIIIF